VFITTVNYISENVNFILKYEIKCQTSAASTAAYLFPRSWNLQFSSHAT